MTEHANLAAALAAVQAKLPTVHKGRKAAITSSKGSYAYSYADLSDVTAAVMPLLAANGLVFLGLPGPAAQGGYELVGELLHTSGEKRTASLPLVGGTPQQWGSSITYMRRYLLGCMTGVVTDDDDDARAATDAAKQARAEMHRQQAEADVPRISEAQSKRMHALLHECGISERPKCLKLASWSAGRELESTSDLTAREAAAFIDYLATRAADAQKETQSE